MSGGNWTAYVVGAVVGIVIGIATAGVGLAAYAATAGTLAFGVTTSLMMANNSQKMGGTAGLTNAAAKDLEIASSSEAIAVPVVWGRVRIGGNYMRYDRSTFRNEPVYAEQQQASGGGKGGGGGSDETPPPQLVGYKYYLSYLYGICMGPIDAIFNVWDANEMKIVGAGTGFSGDNIAVTISGSDFGGGINIYRGSATQTPVVGEPYNDLNYRHVAYASFPDHLIGGSPAPRTILFEVVRWPRVVDDAGTPIAGFYAQGSLTGGGRCWYDANPAAILYEIFTNRVWGRGLSSSLIDLPSFVQGSLFYATNDIGISMAIDTQQNIAESVDFIRRHVNAAVVWTGEKLVLRVLMNPADTTTPVVITSEQVNKISLTRPAWPEQPNELRLEFMNAANQWKTEIVMIQDDAGIETSGTINSAKVVLNGFTDRTTAEAQAQRILNEISYPQATLSFYMNRWASKLVPGDRVEFRWSEFTAEILNTFWRVIEFSDAEQSEDGIRVTLAEDLYATAYLGEPASFAPVDPSFQNDVFSEDGDLYLGEDQNGAYDPGDMLPIRAFELSFSIAQGVRRFIVLQEQGNGGTIYGTHSWALDGTGDYSPFATTQGWAITGALLSAIPVGVQDIGRQASDAFTFSLTNPSNEVAMLASANKVGIAGDHLSTLTQGLTDLLFVNGEVFFVGKITETSPGVYQAENWLRAQFGTERAAHAIADKVYFVKAFSQTAFVVSQGAIPDAAAVDMRTNAATPYGVIGTNFPWTGPTADAFIGLGVRPYSPSYVSHTKVSDTWNVNIRPRWHNAGMGSHDILTDDLGALVTTAPTGYTFKVQAYNGASPLTPEAVPVAPSFVPDNGTDAAGGLHQFSYTAPSGSTHLYVWYLYNGAASLAPTIIPA